MRVIFVAVCEGRGQEVLSLLFLCHSHHAYENHTSIPSRLVASQRWLQVSVQSTHVSTTLPRAPRLPRIPQYAIPLYLPVCKQDKANMGGAGVYRTHTTHTWDNFPCDISQIILWTAASRSGGGKSNVTKTWTNRIET